MRIQFSYPVICSDKFKQSVAFYEDHFNFSPVFESKGYVLLKRNAWEDNYLAIMDSQYEELPEAYKRPAQGMILNYPVDSVVGFYDYVYHEGLSLVSEPADGVDCGRSHFYVADPNGILIDVAESIDIASLITPENQDHFMMRQGAS